MAIISSKAAQNEFDVSIDSSPYCRLTTNANDFQPLHHGIDSLLDLSEVTEHSVLILRTRTEPGPLLVLRGNSLAVHWVGRYRTSNVHNLATVIGPAGVMSCRLPMGLKASSTEFGSHRRAAATRAVLLRRRWDN